jgi:hypothetical protein
MARRGQSRLSLVRPPGSPALNPDPKGYYAVLEVQPNASAALIRAAYRVRAMELHPDRNDALLSTSHFQRLQEAFEILGDPERKAAYDDWARDQKPAAIIRPTEAPPRASAVRRRPRVAAWAAGAILALGGVALAIFMLGEQTPAEAPVRTAVPVKQEAAVQARPLPTSGILQLNLASEAFAKSDQLPRLRLVAPRDANYLVKLSTWDDNAPAMSVFVRAGEATEVLVPVGRYRIRLASGVQWFGEALRFGPTTEYGRVDTLSEFQPIGNRSMKLELQLGDTSATPIAAGSF